MAGITNTNIAEARKLERRRLNPFLREVVRNGNTLVALPHHTTDNEKKIKDAKKRMKTKIDKIMAAVNTSTTPDDANPSTSSGA